MLYGFDADTCKVDFFFRKRLLEIALGPSPTFVGVGRHHEM